MVGTGKTCWGLLGVTLGVAQTETESHERLRVDVPTCRCMRTLTASLILCLPTHLGMMRPVYRHVLHCTLQPV